jgi:hypothetical protein
LEYWNDGIVGFLTVELSSSLITPAHRKIFACQIKSNGNEKLIIFYSGRGVCGIVG